MRTSVAEWTRREVIGLGALGSVLMVPAGVQAALGAPGSAGTSPTDFLAAADYSKARGGSSVLVSRDGEVLFERYDNGAGAGDAIHMASATKSFWGIAALAMVEDGFMMLDDLAAKTLPEWESDPRKSRVTIRHLLTLTSGLAEDIPALQGFVRRPTWAADKYAHAIALPAESEPGTKFRYGPSHFYAFGEIMKRKLASRNLSPLGYLEERILRPIGCAYGRWVHDDAGNPHIPNGCYITARDWAKFGTFVLQGGEWQGRQIVAASNVAQCAVPSAVNPGYGLFWWLNRPCGQGASPRQIAPSGSPGGFIYFCGESDICAALGAGRNGLYLIPSHNLVVVRQLDQEGALATDRRKAGDAASITGEFGFADHAFLSLLLGKAC